MRYIQRAKKLRIKKGGPVSMYLNGLPLMLTNIMNHGKWHNNSRPCAGNGSICFPPAPPPPHPNQFTDHVNITSINQLIKHSFWSTLPWFPGVPNFPTGPGRPFSPFSPPGPGGPGGPTAEIPGSPFSPVRHYSSLNISTFIPWKLYIWTHTTAAV